MLWRAWVRPEPEPKEGGLIGFRRELLLWASIFVLSGAWLLFLQAMAKGYVAPLDWQVLGLGATLAVLTLGLRARWPRRAAGLLGMGSLAFVALCFLAYRQPVFLSFLALSVLAGGLCLGTPFEPGLGVVAAVLVVRLLARYPAEQPVSHWLALVAAASGLGFIANRGLQLIDHWEREVTTQQRQMILKLRERQGELNRTLKALDEAYESLKRANHEMAVARQMAEEARAFKEQFVANISHELRTPLNLIVGFAEVMYLEPETYGDVNWPPPLLADVQQIYRASRHLQSLVNDILDLARIDAARLPVLRELHDLRAIIAEAADTLSPVFRRKGLSFELRCPEGLPQLYLDRTRIRQVLLNLFNNAARYTEEGGITVQVKKNEDSLMVSVRDTGAGIAPEQLEVVFERFRQVEGGLRRTEGAGLGLTLSRQFVELHGGRMWCESKVGEGSVFHFTLPLPGALPQTTPLIRTPGRQWLDPTAGCVLVVDPDPGVSDMLSRYLEGRPVLHAAGVEEAEAAVEKAHPLAVVVNQPPDAAPGDWLGALGEHSQRYGVPILRCSIPSPSWLKLAGGLDGCLTKPVSRPALRQLLKEHDVGRGPVLIVDDDPGFVSLMARLLQRLSPETEVLRATSGTQALRLAKERVPRLVLLDLVMPEMDGWEVLDALRGEPDLAATPIIAVTATSYVEDALRQRGTLLTLTQPLGISPGAVVELLNAVLRAVRPSYVAAQPSRSRA